MSSTPPHPRAPTTPGGPGSAGTHPSGPAGARPPHDRPPGARREASTGASLAALIGDVARLYLEVESGRRPAAQLRGLLTHRLAAQLEQVWVRPGAPGAVLTTTGSRTAPDVFEGVAVVRRGERVGAIAICLIRRRGRWFVAAASRPEDGVLPEPEWPIPDDEEDALDKLDAHDAPATPEADTSTRGGIAPLSLV